MSKATPHYKAPEHVPSKTEGHVLDHHHEHEQNNGHHHHHHDGVACGHDHSHDAAHHHDPIVNAGGKIGRNDHCPCGSGKKYKKCCLA